MSYTTEHYHFDLLRDYMNGATEPHQWEELRDFALDILDAYAERFDSVAERFNAPTLTPPTPSPRTSPYDHHRNCHHDTHDPLRRSVLE